MRLSGRKDRKNRSGNSFANENYLTLSRLVCIKKREKKGRRAQREEEEMKSEESDKLRYYYPRKMKTFGGKFPERKSRSVEKFCGFSNRCKRETFLSKRNLFIVRPSVIIERNRRNKMHFVSAAGDNRKKLFK